VHAISTAPNAAPPPLANYNIFLYIENFLLKFTQKSARAPGGLAVAPPLQGLAIRIWASAALMYLVADLNF